MWPANRRDLNPVDYCIWGMMQKRVYQVYQSEIRTICGSGLLRHGLIYIFHYSVVDDAINQWRERLKAYRADGGHFEHVLRRCLPDIQVATQHK